MYAAFIFDGTTPYSSDQLNSRQRNGASRFELVFSSCVGSGSKVAEGVKKLEFLAFGKLFL